MGRFRSVQQPREQTFGVEAGEPVAEALSLRGDLREFILDVNEDRMHRRRLA